MAVRMTRQERSEQTRAELVEAARKAFLRSGFHGASLDDISLEAGYTTGAVYSRFGGKDALFLAVLDDHIDRRVRAYLEVSRSAPDFEGACRELGRAAVAAGKKEPGWTPLLMEFWMHAARREDLRAAVVERNERQLAVLAEALEKIAARDGLTPKRPVAEILRAVTALARGLGLERQIAPDAPLEEIYTEYAWAMTQAFTERSTT
ncbi:MAG TPA: TetR/AcrR family transcriptional regulator [Solirubrobacteraceae bacterium]|nr:TetR/AcrR family transcriptional regulator [Solirubrobacteraceae bacterium]